MVNIEKVHCLRKVNREIERILSTLDKETLESLEVMDFHNPVQDALDSAKKSITCEA
jgi:hypothetical protein